MECTGANQALSPFAPASQDDVLASSLLAGVPCVSTDNPLLQN